VLAAKGGIRPLRGARLRARIFEELDAIEAHYPSVVPVVEVIEAASLGDVADLGALRGGGDA
jgi:hypothetical protein